MKLPGELTIAVRRRAADRCQYCLMHQSLQGATFHIEHIVPRSKGGKTQSTNLALACPSCNLHKSDYTTAIDRESGQIVPMFNPVQNRWLDHFSFAGLQIMGLTPIGRATVQALRLNHPRRLRIRVAEQRFGLFPPKQVS